MPLPEVFNHQDELLTLNTNEEPIIEDVMPGYSGLDVWPLYLDAEKGVWVLRVRFSPGMTLPTHYHTGVVHFYTVSGCWNYLEYPDQPQTAGCYLFEPGGSIHTFHCPADSDGADGVMVIEGANINFDRDGNYLNIMDASWIEQMIVAAARKQGIDKPRYFKPKSPVGPAFDE